MTKPEPRNELETFLRETFPEYWDSDSVELEEDCGKMHMGFDPAEPIFDKLKASGFHEDAYPSVDRDMLEGYQSVEHNLVHPVYGCVIFSHSMAWEPSLFEMPQTTSWADGLIWEVELPKAEFYIGHRVG